MHRRATTLLTVALLLAACSDETILGPVTLPPGAVTYDALPIYTRWWADMEACSGRTGDLSRVNWFVVPNAKWFGREGVAYDGYWFEYHHEIILASAYVQDSLVVRHEMLHDLLDDGTHPPEYFVDRCGPQLGARSTSLDRVR
jgi:hypothetical protein